MSERKQEIIEELNRKGIDPVKLERDLVAILRKGASAVEVSIYFKKIIEGERHE